MSAGRAVAAHHLVETGRALASGHRRRIMGANENLCCPGRIGPCTTSSTSGSRSGTPGGHFVLLYDYEPEERIVHVADPYQDNPLTDGLHYAVGMDRLVGAILLGVITWDANLTIVEPGAAGAKT